MIGQTVIRHLAYLRRIRCSNTGWSRWSASGRRRLFMQVPRIIAGPKPHSGVKAGEETGETPEVSRKDDLGWLEADQRMETTTTTMIGVKGKMETHGRGCLSSSKNFSWGSFTSTHFSKKDHLVVVKPHRPLPIDAERTSLAQ